MNDWTEVDKALEVYVLNGWMVLTEDQKRLVSGVISIPWVGEETEGGEK